MEKRSGSVVATIASLAGFMVVAYALNAFPAAMLRIAAEWKIDSKMLAQAQVFQFLSYGISLIGGGFLADRIGKKPVFLLSCLAHAGGAFLMSRAGGFHLACGANLLLGVGNGVLQGIGTALIGDLFPVRRKLAMNLSQAMFCVGAIGGPALFGWLLPSGIDWRLFYLALAIVDLLLLCLYGVADIPKPSEQTPTLRQTLSVFRYSAVWIGCALIFLYVAGETSAVVFMNDYLQTELNAPEGWAVTGISMFWGAMLIGRILCSLIPERVSYRRILVMHFSGGILSLVLFGWLGSWQWALAAFLLFGIFCSGTWPSIVGMSAARFPQQSGIVVGVTVSAGSLGCIFITPMMKFLWGVVDSRWLFPSVSVLFLIALILIRLLPKRSSDGSASGV